MTPMLKYLPLLFLPLLTPHPASAEVRHLEIGDERPKPVKVACYNSVEMEALEKGRGLKSVLAGTDQTGELFLILYDPTVKMSYVFQPYDDLMCIARVLKPTIVFRSPLDDFPDVEDKK